MSEIESSTPASTSARGPVGETRSVGLSILWFILTIGIYGIYWVYKTQEEVRRYSGNGIGGVPIAGPIIWFVQVQGALNRYWESKGASPA